jgi:putative endonuclease
MVTEKRIKGNKGEDISCTFLERKGFVITDRNYLRKWGELDIVAHKDGIVHFFEVKSVTWMPVVRGNAHRPEENVNLFKGHKLRKIISTYLVDKGIGEETAFQFHVLCVYMNMKTRKARVEMIENVIL